MAKFGELEREAEYYQRAYEESVATVNAQELNLKQL